MSYGIGLHFKHINSEADILDLMYNIQQEYADEKNVQELLEANQSWLLDRYSRCRELNLVDGKFSRSPLFNYFMQNIFTYRLYYWKDYKLVALSSKTNVLPKHLEKYFDGYIYFQNYHDQDYDYKEWDVLGDLANYFIKQAKHKSSKELYTILYGHEPDRSEDLDARRDYDEKTYVYKCIEETLDINNTLWLSPMSKFKYFEFTKSFNYDNYDIEAQTINFLEGLYKEKYNE